MANKMQNMTNRRFQEVKLRPFLICLIDMRLSLFFVDIRL